VRKLNHEFPEMDTKKINPFIPGGPHSECRRGNGLFFEFILGWTIGAIGV